MRPLHISMVIYCAALSLEDEIFGVSEMHCARRDLNSQPDKYKNRPDGPCHEPPPPHRTSLLLQPAPTTSATSSRHAMHPLPCRSTSSMRLGSKTKVTAVLADPASAPMLSDVQEVEIGQSLRQMPHTPRHPSPEFDVRELARLRPYMPKLHSLKVAGPVTWNAVLALHFQALNPGDSPPSVFVQVHDAAIPDDTPNARLYVEKDIPIAIPSTSSWQSAAPDGPAFALLASAMMLEVSDVCAATDAALVHGGKVVAFFGGCLQAFRNLRNVLFTRRASIDIRVLTVSWTAAHNLVNCGGKLSSVVGDLMADVPCSRDGTGLVSRPIRLHYSRASYSFHLPRIHRIRYPRGSVGSDPRSPRRRHTSLPATELNACRTRGGRSSRTL